MAYTITASILILGTDLSVAVLEVPELTKYQPVFVVHAYHMKHHLSSTILPPQHTSAQHTETVLSCFTFMTSKLVPSQNTDRLLNDSWPIVDC